jgi:hypothetical protein
MPFLCRGSDSSKVSEVDSFVGWVDFSGENRGPGLVVLYPPTFPMGKLCIADVNP